MHGKRSEYRTGLLPAMQLIFMYSNSRVCIYTFKCLGKISKSYVATDLLLTAFLTRMAHGSQRRIFLGPEHWNIQVRMYQRTNGWILCQHCCRSTWIAVMSSPQRCCSLYPHTSWMRMLQQMHLLTYLPVRDNAQFMDDTGQDGMGTILVQASIWLMASNGSSW